MLPWVWHSMRSKVGKPYLLLGALLWVSSIQYFIVQLVVVSAWPVPHSWSNHFISDLGNTECGLYAGLEVCSPLHLLMNISFVVYGLTMAIGAWLLLSQFERLRLLRVGLWLMILAGIGTMLVGLFPENTIQPLHVLGAVLALGVGNVAVLLVGLGGSTLGRLMRSYTVFSGVVSLVAFGLFAAELYGFLGRGGMERLVSYTFTIWMIVFGVSLAIKHSLATKIVTE